MSVSRPHTIGIGSWNIRNVIAHLAGLTKNVPGFIFNSRGMAMGMEDREWYRDKQIDWDRGGLREKKPARRRFPKYTWWVLVAILLIVAAALFRPI
jgi:hypothetical protein